MRTFIAIEIPEEFKTALAELQNDLRRARAGVSWTSPENIHLTLKFLGEVEESRVAEISAACARVAGTSRPFALQLGFPGVFPDARRPRVIWAGLQGEVEVLSALQKDLEERISAIGLKGDEKEFHPHLTVGRVKSARNSRELIARAELYDLPPLSFDVREIVLIRSVLHPAGAQYTPMARASLGR
jgi:2'-5' RNA ligase